MLLLREEYLNYPGGSRESVAAFFAADRLCKSLWGEKFYAVFKMFQK